MTKTDKLLRRFIAQEIVALIERIDATDSPGDSSYHAAHHLLREGQLSFIERKLLSSALSKVARRETLVRAMNVVVFNNINGEVIQPDKWGASTGTTGKANPLNMNTLLAQSAQQAWMRQQESDLQNGKAMNQAQQPPWRNTYGSSL